MGRVGATPSDTDTASIAPAGPGAPGAATAPTVESARLARSDRREALLDAAALLVAELGVEAVSMETVADQAAVSRALVYKHFANRTEILTALYRREAALLHEELAEPVRAATTVEDMYRALIRASFAVSEERGHLFAALRAAGAWNRDLRTEQRARDRQTVKAFAARAADEFGIPEDVARPATALLLGATDSVLVQWRARRTPANAVKLEGIYMDLVLGGLGRLADRRGRQ